MDVYSGRRLVRSSDIATLFCENSLRMPYPLNIPSSVTVELVHHTPIIW